MRKRIFPALALLLCLLCGCGRFIDGLSLTQSPGTPEETAAVGYYVCTELQQDGQALNLMDKWLDLAEDGSMTLSLYGSPDSAQWTLEGNTLSILMEGSVVGTGALQGDTLKITIMGLSGTFIREGKSAPLTNSSEAPPAQEIAAGDKSFEADDGVFACYDNLYYVRYPADRFSLDPARMTDLRSKDGTQVWITRLDSPERVDMVSSSFATIENSGRYEGLESSQWTVAGYPAQLILYQEDTDAWHSEILVNFGGNLGSGSRTMYAAYFIFSGDSREAVWGRDAQGIVNSLKLGNESPTGAG